MDNAKTGAFIRALRTEQGLTQRQLAERLHITDRAVSKWERGLNAPDIALLEPLADTLGVSVVDLIRGERIPPEERTPAMKEHARGLLLCFGEELRRRRRSLWKKSALIAAVLLILFAVWSMRTGYFFLLDDCPSPDGTARFRIYSKERQDGWFTWQDGVTMTHGPALTYLFGDCVYKGLLWSPDSRGFVLSLDYDGRTDLCMVSDQFLVHWLKPSLANAMEASRLGDYGLPFRPGSTRWDYIVECQFVQWGPDINSMLIWYSFTGDNDGLEHSGYFWFDYEQIRLSGLFELDGSASS